MIHTTLNRIREHSPCAEGWTKLLKHLGKTKPDDEPVSFVTILESNGLDDALWCCRAEPEQAALWRHFAVDCAESVRHLMTDARSTAALDVARRHANGEATDNELSAACAAAWDAASAAACAAAWDAASAAACAAACAAAWDAASAAACAAAWDAAWDAASAAACAAARDAACAAMAQRFRYLVTAGQWSPVAQQEAA
jgi:hypothetical protein